MRHSKECGLLQVLNSDTIRNILDVFVHPFLCKSQGPYHQWYCCGFIPHIRSISISRSLHLDSFSVTFTEVFLLVGMVISMSGQRFSFLFLMMMSGLLAFISQSVCIGMSHKIMRSSFSDIAWAHVPCSYHFALVLLLNSLQIFHCRSEAACAYVDIQFWPAQGSSCHNMVKGFLELTTYPTH